MTIQKNSWQPDTCMCEIEYTWDDTVPQDQRVHTMSKVTRCMFHQALPHIDAYKAVHDENQSKNKALARVIESFPALKAVDIKYRFNLDRSIVIELPDEAKIGKVALTNAVKGLFAKEVTFE